ncbi:hypothetical protein CASFOL_006808 [Castilleja foliolosa]|uniref:F-box domain-containing protein n=1 Tax=Castilleja foliolosa TaxID=1961234 RepID=A0ABD3E7G2_9LAMI
MVKLLKMNDGDEAEKPSSAQIVASIDDLIIEIIHRLPLKPLVQLRLVSNNWNSLISDANLRLWHNRPAVGLICEGRKMEHLYTITSKPLNSYIISLDKSNSPLIRKLTPTKDTWYRYYTIMHSCNGLLLCLIKEHNSSERHYVCNPTTRKYIALPELELDHSMYIIGMYLAFDPSKSPHYKVFCVARSFEYRLRLFQVYSSETGSWRIVGPLFKEETNFDSENGVYWNGAIHWLNISNGPRESVYFNLDYDETLKVFPMPPLQHKYYDRIEDYYFGESCDHLHFVDVYRKLNQFIVYEMKRDYSEWFVKYKVDVNVPDVKTISSFSVVRCKNDEDSFMVFAIGEELIRRIEKYNFDQKTCETLFFSTNDYGIYLLVIRPKFQYIESVCSV